MAAKIPEGKQLLSESNIESTPPVSVEESCHHRRSRCCVIFGGLIAGLGFIGIIVTILVQFKFASYPAYQNVLVVDVKNDVIEAALIRRGNPALRKHSAAEAVKSRSLDSTVLSVCGRRGGDLHEMVETCVDRLLTSLPENSDASLVFTLTGREILKQWVGCNITSAAKRIGQIAMAVAKKHKAVLHLADEDDRGVRLVMAKEQAISSFIGANSQHLDNSSTGVVGFDSKSAFIAFQHEQKVVSLTDQTGGSPIFDEQISGQHISAFSEAFYCFGVEEMWRIYLTTLLGGNPVAPRAKDPCAPAQTLYSVQWTEIWQSSCSENILKSQTRPVECPGEGKNYHQIASVDFTGIGNPTECRTRLEALFKTAKSSSKDHYAGQRIPKQPTGEFVLFDGIGSIARAFEFAFKYRKIVKRQKIADETVLDGRDLYLGDVSAAVHELCSRNLDPKQLRDMFNLATTRQENDGTGLNSDAVLRRTCFDAVYGVEFLASLGFAKVKADDENPPPNHIVLARPPLSDIDEEEVQVVVQSQDHSEDDPGHDHEGRNTTTHTGLHHSGHQTAEWMAGYLETGAAISGDYRKVRILCSMSFIILLSILSAMIVIGLILVIVYAIRLCRSRTLHLR